MTTATRLTPQQLIEKHQGLLRSLAIKMHRGLHLSVELDDLIGYGQVGLAEAARDFDPGRGMEFSTFAYYRVRGAMYDGLSKLLWFSRAHYRRLRCQQQSDEILRQEAEATDGDHTGTVESDAAWLERLVSSLAVVYLATSDRDDETESPLTVVDTRSPAPDSAVAVQETRQLLQGLIQALPADAGQLLRATYFEGLTLQEAGQRLGMSKSWASRLHARSLQQLGRALRSQGIHHA